MSVQSGQDEFFVVRGGEAGCWRCRCRCFGRRREAEFAEGNRGKRRFVLAVVVWWWGVGACVCVWCAVVLCEIGE